MISITCSTTNKPIIRSLFFSSHSYIFPWFCFKINTIIPINRYIFYKLSYLDTFCKKYFGKTPKEIRKEAIGKTV